MGQTEATQSARVIGVRIAGTGHYLPGPPITQEELRTRLRAQPDGLPASVQDRLLADSGITTRFSAVAREPNVPGETNASMAAEAGRRAIAAAGWSPPDVELLIVTTVIPDQLIPPTSTLVQEALGIERCAELEISANCTAPYKAVLAAANQLRLGQCRRALVCSSQFVSFLGVSPWAIPDRMTASQAQLRWLLSDGAGAIALEAGEPDTGLELWTESSGAQRAAGMELAVGAAHPDLADVLARGLHHVAQHVRGLHTHAVHDAADRLRRMLSQFGIAAADIDHLIIEVPTMRIAEAARDYFAAHLDIPASVWRVDLPEIGNVGGATFPIVLDRLVRAGRLRPGELVVSFAEESSKWMFAGAAFRWNP